MSVIKNINYQVGSFELHIKEWTFPDEGLTLLCGPSGSGKTTLIRILCGLLPAPGFSWMFKNIDLAQLKPEDRGLSVLFQDLCLFPALSVAENMLFPLKAGQAPLAEARKKVHQMALELGLKEKLSQFPEELSGGEKQRLALARALICTPRFLFLDEPFVHLDSKTRKEAALCALRIIEKQSIPALLVTHDWKRFEPLSRQIYHLP